jgi:hypothetical protein
MFTLILSDDIAVSKAINHTGNKLPCEIEITEEQHNQVNEFPVKLTIENGEVVSWEVAEIVNTITSAEMREQIYASQKIIEWNDESITVDEANVIFLRYFAENSPKATEVQALIVTAKESIREQYPDAEV